MSTHLQAKTLKNLIERQANSVNDSFDDITVNQMTLARTFNNVISETTKRYLSTIDRNNPPSPETIERELLSDTNSEIVSENMSIPYVVQKDANGSVLLDKSGNPKKIPLRPTWKCIDRLFPQQIVEIILFFHNIIRIDAAETNIECDNDLIAIYCDSGPNEGVYDINDSTLSTIVKQYDYLLDDDKFKEICFLLKTQAPRKMRNHDRDLIAVNNGIFNYRTKVLQPFDPNIVFLSKSHVNYNPNAQLVNIHNPIDNTDWNIESWMSELSEDPAVVALLWQMLGAIIRPFVRWGRSIWLYSTTGNNGKGTLCHLMRKLCGDGTHTSISLNQFSKNFATQPLMHSSAIIVDENDVGVYLDKLAVLKAVVTNDIIQIDRKFKEPISFRFWGFMVQCINDLPRIRDKSDSFYRRQILVPMDKCFTGAERKYIKDDYIERPEVLEYVLKKVLNSNFYEFDIPERCQNLLGMYKEMNDPVREFLIEFKEKWVWDLLPMEFLYDLYKSWYIRCNPSGKPEGKTSFKKQIEILLLEPEFGSYWMATGCAMRVGDKMSRPEPLIAQYNLENWKNPNYNGSDVNKISTPKLTSSRYRGITRRPNCPAIHNDDDDSDDAESAGQE